METDPLESMGAELPDRFPVVVIMESTPVTGNRWIDRRWQAVGVSVDTGLTNADQAPQLIRREDGHGEQSLHGGFTVRLYVDECESYYYNLVAPEPRCFVVATLDDDGTPTPRLVTLSFDEAHAYLEGEGELYSVSLVPELYRWTEAFVLAHYVPQPRRKRKLDNWRDPTGGGR